MSNLQTYYHLKIDIQKVDQHTGGKLSIHGIKHRKGNQLQCPELPCFLFPSRESHHDTKSPKVTCSIQYSNGMSSCGNIHGGAHLQNQKYYVIESLNV